MTFRPSSLLWVVGVISRGPLGYAQPVVLPGTQPRGLTARLEPAAQCQECHSGNETAGHTYMPHDTWTSSMMANAARDPLFLATLEVANTQLPELGQYCLRCHTPSGFTAGRASPGSGAALDPLADNDGVHCDSCHRSLDPRAQTPTIPIGNAQLLFADAPLGMLPARQGPRMDPFTSPRHPSVYSAFIRDSAMCGQCHDVDNPLTRRLSATGMDTGQVFPLQSTYTEWQQSNFSRGPTARSCQDCHMPAEPGNLLVSRIPGSPLRPNPRRHDFVGANAWGMAMLRSAYPGELDAEFDAARLRNQAFLTTAARVEITSAPTDLRAGTQGSITVRVTNLSGHKLPTGYEDARLMWLEVSAGPRVISGDYQNDELVESPGVRTYRFQAGRFEAGRVTPSDFVARHNTVMEDTRIPPEGMIPNARTAPVGRDYSGGTGGALRNFDTAMFDLALPSTTPNGPLNITVRLMYQTTTKHYVEAITNAAPGTPRSTNLLNAWNLSGRAAPFAMATATARVNVLGGANPPPDGGLTDAGRDTGPGDSGARDTGPSSDLMSPMDPSGCNCHTTSGPRGSLGALLAASIVGLMRRKKAHTQ